MREGEKKKHLRKKNIGHIFGNIHISGKVNEDDEKNKQKENIAGKIFFISRNKLVFFSKCFFYLSKLAVFSGNRQQSNAHLTQCNSACIPKLTFQMISF